MSKLFRRRRHHPRVAGHRAGWRRWRSSVLHTSRNMLERGTDFFYFDFRERKCFNKMKKLQQKPFYTLINRFGSPVNRSRLWAEPVLLDPSPIFFLLLICLCWLHPLNACCTPCFFEKSFSLMLIFATFMHFVQISFFTSYLSYHIVYLWI